MIYLILSLGIFTAFFVGFYLREVLDTLHKLIDRLDTLKQAQDKKPPETNFAEPMTRTEMAALLEEEKIDLLNR